MRTHRYRLLAICAWAVHLACGAASTEPKSAEAPSPASSANSVTPAPPEPGPSTTTSTVAGPGDGQPTKLSDAAASGGGSPAAANSGGSGTHAREPGRGPEDIRAIVMSHRDEARACYEKGAKDHPGIEGDLVVQWTIDPKGTVTQVSIDTSRSQISEPAVAACIANVIKKISFAASPGGYETKASYPFNFHPRRAARTDAP